MGKNTKEIGKLTNAMATGLSYSQMAVLTKGIILRIEWRAKGNTLGLEASFIRGSF